ncbi:AcetylCholine Receptor [Caenorhabditis elegans]|uniref:AcetylCholine Receptor n=3 Tax=Caenorhabditis elegans TaxID=6239 RepID=B1Q281_CAEEL|nr:AcetylCholine Receptor [Caenorhabditis elegans]CAQ16152.1 AcetylCholine Receptor [Caenorhabditis elegans]|eukprot:NP_001122627.1 AcetylCholine Receptor [Caenorhabditis elegans]
MSSGRQAAVLLLHSLVLLTVSSDQYEIANKILDKYNAGLIPSMGKKSPIEVHFSMELYQIISVNEPQQFLMLNAWVVERWTDRLLGWDPEKFGNVTEIMLPHHFIWLPDTTLYNSLVMKDDENRRLLHAKVTTLGEGNGAFIELLYPTIYKLSCLLNLRFFPFDVQSCRLLFGSWTFDNTKIDYFAFNESQAIGTTNCIENEGWNVLSTSVIRHENKYDCCPNNYTLLEFRLTIQRKPLYYIINLIIPTSIITFISIIGFFSTSSINEPREEKITLGITTLLSMSILIFMVSDKMPSTSSFIPLIGLFYTSMILLISFSTICSSVVIYVQKQGNLGNPPSKNFMNIARAVNRFIRMEMPLIMKQAYAQKAREEKLRRQQMGRKQSLWTRVYKLAREQALRKDVQTSQNSSKFNEVLTPEKLIDNGGKRCTINKDVTCISDSGIVAMGVPTLASEDDDQDVSLLELETTPTPAMQRPTRLHKASTCGSFDSMMFRQIEVPVSPRTARNLAEIEYDWLAALLERIFLITFLFIFVLTSIGINLIGFFYWWMAPDTVRV